MGNKMVKTRIGMRSSYFAPHVSTPLNAHPVCGDVLDMGAAVKGYLTVTTAELKIPGDDEILVYDEKFVSGQLDAETTLDDLELNAAVFGHRYANGVETSGKDDTAPSGSYAYIEPFLKRDKTVVYRATFLYSVTAKMSAEKSESDTKKDSLEPKMNAVSYAVAADNTGAWRDRAEFGHEAEAEAWIAQRFGTAAGYTVAVSCFGGGVDKPTVYAEAGANVALTFTAAPSAVFDNGEDVTEDVSDKVYTISGIAANHSIVAIFA